MRYNNATNVFPKELVAEMRKYISEGFIYIPSSDKRKEWGSLSGQKQELINRNTLIYKQYKSGKTIQQIANEQYLSVSSVYRIVSLMKD